MTTQGEMIRVEAADGFMTDTWRVVPEGEPRAGLIVAMEAFGLNDHMRRVAAGFADEGYAVLMPALYDRIQRNALFDYKEQLQDAVAVMKENGFDNPMKDVEGCLAQFRREGIERVGIVGYCYGGAVAWLAAARIAGIDAAVSYYGSAIMQYGEQEKPRCPTMAHWGRHDPTTPPEQVEAVAAANPQVVMHSYDAGHGFNCDDRPDFDPESADRARERTLAFFREHLIES